MRSRSKSPGFAILLCGLAALLSLPIIRAEEISLIGATTVDPSALTFADGPATRFGPTPNGRTHQQDPLTTYRGWQYVIDIQRWKEGKILSIYSQEPPSKIVRTNQSKALAASLPR
jgi:hypothetical protein